MFIHDHPEFEALLSIVSDRRGVSVALIEKDYWVTHTLWALAASGIQAWFKGGTSLSKGYGIIERFSEDLDLKLEAPGLPTVTSWKAQGARCCQERQSFFKALQSMLHIPGAEVAELSGLRDLDWRAAVFAILYPSRFSGHLPAGVSPFVQLEVGSARVTPGEARTITSWIHEQLSQPGGAPPGLIDNRARSVHCVSPDVTLLEKIEAICRRYRRDPFDPASFVRHYEDAVRILNHRAAPNAGLRSLLGEMTAAADIRSWPSSQDAAFNPEADTGRWMALESAWQAIEPTFWGERLPARACAERIRELLVALSR